MNDTPETLASRRSRAWWARPGVWIITVGVAAIVVIEGFALSWGGTTSRPSMDSSATVVTFAKQPSYQASCVGGHTYLEVDYLRYASGLQPATITGHEATYQCGGPDDGQFTVLPTVRTIALSPRNQVVQVSKIGPRTIFRTN